MSLTEWPWVTQPPWNELPPTLPACKLALIEAPLCQGVEPTYSGAEVTGGTLTGPPLFSGTGGGVQWGKMLGHGCKSLLPHSSPATWLPLPGSSSEQDKELQGVLILRMEVPLAARPTKVKDKPMFPSLPKGLPHASHQQQARAGISFRKSPGLATGTQQDQPYPPLHLPGWGPGLSGRAPLCPLLPRP